MALEFRKYGKTTNLKISQPWSNLLFHNSKSIDWSFAYGIFNNQTISMTVPGGIEIGYDLVAAVINKKDS